MSVLSDGIGYESLRFYGPFQPQHIEQLQITRTINDHAYLHIDGLLSEEQGAACIGQDMEQEPIVIRQLNDQGQSLRRLFHGIVTRMSVHCVRGVYTFELEAASHSYQMDIKRKRRSYQDTHRTYDDLVTALVRKYQYGDAIDTVSNYAKLETFVLQYEETDWAFLKRLASRFGSVLVPEVTAASPKVFFGMPEGKQHKVERDVFYRVRKTFHELDGKKPGERAGSYVTYMIESLQYYALGDLITLPIGQGKELVVVRAVTTLADGLLRTRYDLQTEQDIRYARYENDQATGISLTGTVLKVQQDFVQLQLEIDPKQDPAKACWFPVVTRYVAEEHSGWYDMPEVGEQVELYLPTHCEQDAYVTDSLRQQRHTKGQPNVKVWQHVQGSGVEMSEHELTLSTSGEFSITLHESSGITIDSPGNVQIQGGHVKLDAGEELSLEAGTALYLKGGASSMVLDGETDTKAPVIYQEGTVKAPVFVADLPPVPEPPLMSIKAYEKAQAPSAAKTSSSSTPTAKVTSPAALQQANSLLGTVSKLLGSIPVMGKVAGVVAGALGGPAVGVILKATAMIPVRSKGTPTIGGGKGNGTHPLKHLAGLALQGLINKYEHDQARQAYYSKWILGKVFTSARHIAHSGGPLELVQNLLKESNAMVHAYQQIPVDLRQRWRANYDSYMAAEKAKVSYNFDEYDKKFMGTMWVLSKNGVTDQKAAQATLAYNEAIKNGEIKLHHEPENVDIFVEQIKAAKEGKNYWTGEEIPEWQANAIIISSVFSEFQMVGSLYGAKFGRNIKIPSKSIKAPVSIVEEPGVVKPAPSKPIEPPAVSRKTGAYNSSHNGTSGQGLGRLEGKELNVSEKGLNIVKKHLSSNFEEFPENTAMIKRLEDALANKKKISGADASFYMHEVSESTMMKKGIDYDTAHEMALQKYDVSRFSVYHPDVIESMPKIFNKNWRKFWGLE
ncbi:contractile injection system protein, VgrG/Pvc8 family [Paenibacillus polymyxa]|uniref:Contractile injection system protein, VgrG/Pvc8 family n=1 Tax=Paenibacillus polymyxa TaxID=1406 RepID=A0AAP4A234_PAEPO|nr:contractile injection system protein, VgrG/Pvc8 family [Paenibacillus polymyxa]MDH2333877.1 contractile injection system protein, VgrG/Pvc8 family [Paenibacillus polymyxa]